MAIIGTGDVWNMRRKLLPRYFRQQRPCRRRFARARSHVWPQHRRIRVEGIALDQSSSILSHGIYEYPPARARVDDTRRLRPLEAPRHRIRESVGADSERITDRRQ